MPSKTARPHAYHHGDLRRALLHEATVELRERGASNLSLRELARRVGVSPAAPYAHFADKDALLAALAEGGFRALVVSLRRAFRAGPVEPWARFTAMTSAYVRFALEHPAHLAIMFGPERPAIDRYPSLHEAAHDAMGLMLVAIHDCQATGAVVSGDPMALGLFGWVVIHGLAVLLAAGMLPGVTPGRVQPAETSRLVAAMMERAMLGLAPRDPGPRPAAASGRRDGSAARRAPRQRRLSSRGAR